MRFMTGNEIRSAFLTYFSNHKHQVIRSSPLIPADDPTLLFVNAGMVQFKRTFLGEEKRSYNRAASSQKCVRAGGKHNDLENVGYTARHHTFFEMLGNFSFGDYFKKEAIIFAWDFLVKELGLPVKDLWVSVYKDDDEAYDIWKTEVGVPENRIVRCSEKDNFWSMGDTGPCGPCSEIHLDRGIKNGCKQLDCAVGCNCDRFIEIWNLVFMQYNRDENGTLTPLPHPSIDTGMGLERIATVLQNVPTNYESDLLAPIISHTASLAKKFPGTDPSIDIALKVIADHSRTMTFLIGDGILPSNEGRGYVLRRIMRRAIRYGRKLGLTEPFLEETTKIVFEIMKEPYPELKENATFIQNVIRNEELRFSETLDNGLRLLEESIKTLRKEKKTILPGNVIFKLYDTFGFPVDIIIDILRETDFTMDIKEFEDLMARQREMSRGSAQFTNTSEAYRNLSAQGIKTAFTGYHSTEGLARVLVITKDGKEIEKADSGMVVEIVTELTPFFAESGGQAGDEGLFTDPQGLLVQITDVVKDPTGLILHRGEIKTGSLKKSSVVEMIVNEESREAIAKNHTATHILHKVLREIVGDHVRQAGSLVTKDRLRFDFTHFSQIELETLLKIEATVNERIQDNIEIYIDEMGLEEATQIGAMALFEEKYADRVRVVSLDDFSKELCGGIHTSATGNIGLFRILSESSVAAGVRRIEAITGAAAVLQMQKETTLLKNTASLLKEKPDQLISRLEKIIANQKSLEKETSQLKQQLASLQATGGGSGVSPIETIHGVEVVAQIVNADDPGALRELADQFKSKMTSGVILLGAQDGEKAFLTAMVTKDLAGKKFHAGDIVNKAAKILGGKGGGRPDMAQAGGPDVTRLKEAVAILKEIVSNS